MNNSILKTVAVITLIVQIIIPAWWATVFASFYYFWVEAIIEGGIFGSETVVGVDQAGNSIIRKCVLTDPCSLSSLAWGLFSLYSIVAVFVSIYSLFFAKREAEQSFSRRGVLFLIINLVTIVGVAITIALNEGIIPRF